MSTLWHHVAAQHLSKSALRKEWVNPAEARITLGKQDWKAIAAVMYLQDAIEQSVTTEGGPDALYAMERSRPRVYLTV